MQDHPPVRSRLWFRNTVAGVVFLAALGGLTVVSFRGPWKDYQASITPANVVPDGQTGTFYGQTWRLNGLKHLGKTPGVSPIFALPKGTQWVIANIERTGPVKEDLYCEGRLSDGTRTWKGSTPVFKVQGSDESTEFCNKPGPMQFAFMVPDDVKFTSLDIDELGGQKILIRFELPAQ